MDNDVPPQPVFKVAKVGGPTRKKNRNSLRRRTVYDAVAGRLRRSDAGNGYGFTGPWLNEEANIEDEQIMAGVTNAFSGTKLHHAAVAPDDLLLHLNAKRSELANGDEAIPVIDHKDLPDSELLKALHYYAAEYYRHTGRPRGFRSMDETALIALGVLVEEKIKEELGPNGHLCYAKSGDHIYDTESEEEEEEEGSNDESSDDSFESAKET
ncbi:hypothetical protein TRVA0_001S04456 [Trichomonascus vanleenenianus]|uniref:uncharacterized protein n=1 Tax=Trichomonascus vanleenenianus TaxID=2268995 RepID=UPI003ECA85FF